MKRVSAKYILAIPPSFLVVVMLVTRACTPEHTIEYTKNYLEDVYKSHIGEFNYLIKVRDSLSENRLCSHFEIEYTGKRFVQTCDTFITAIPYRDYRSDDFLSSEAERTISDMMYDLDLSLITLAPGKIIFRSRKFFNEDFGAEIELYNSRHELLEIEARSVFGKFFIIDTATAVIITSQ